MFFRDRDLRDCKDDMFFRSGGFIFRKGRLLFRSCELSGCKNDLFFRKSDLRFRKSGLSFRKNGFGFRRSDLRFCRILQLIGFERDTQMRGKMDRSPLRSLGVWCGIFFTNRSSA